MRLQKYAHLKKRNQYGFASPKTVTVKFQSIIFPILGDANSNGIFLAEKSLKIGDRGFETRTFGFSCF